MAHLPESLSSESYALVIMASDEHRLIVCAIVNPTGALRERRYLWHSKNDEFTIGPLSPVQLKSDRSQDRHEDRCSKVNLRCENRRVTGSRPRPSINIQPFMDTYDPMLVGVMHLLISIQLLFRLVLLHGEYGGALHSRKEPVPLD